MIIKSLSRKASGGAGGGKSPFRTLIRYMTRGIEDEEGRGVLWHNFFGHEGLSEAEILETFESNAADLKERKNGNVLYHEMLSFSAGHTLSGEALYRAVADIGQEYLRERAPNQLGYGVIHLDTDHIHLHLLISANEIGKPSRVRLSKKDFSDIQKRVERYTLEQYKELGQSLVYDRGNQVTREKLKTQVHEQAMKSRTGGRSRKEDLKSALHQVFERAQSRDELQALADALGAHFYIRGKSVGVMVRDPDGTERRHRLSTLGLMEHYQMTEARLAFPKGKPSPSQSSQSKTQEQDMSETKLGGPGGTVWGMPPDTALDIVAEEFLTGKLHPDWHGKPEPDKSAEARKAYSDDILRKLEERDRAGGVGQRGTPRPEAPPNRSHPTRGRDDDQER